MLVALVIGLVYTLPNFFGEAPAVQVSSGKATVKLDSVTLATIESALASSKITPDGVTFDNSSNNANIRVRLRRPAYNLFVLLNFQRTSRID